MFMRVIDFFVGNLFKQDLDRLYKVRLLVGCLISFVAGVVAFLPYFMLIDGLSTNSILVYVGMAVVLISFWGVLLKLLQKGRAFRFVSHATVASTVLVLYAGIILTGGPTETEVLPLLTVSVVLAFLLLGQGGGLLWTVIIACINYSLVLLAFSGSEFLQMAPEQTRQHLRIFTWSYAFFTIASLVMTYEFMNTRLMRQRDKEREKFQHIAAMAVESSIVNDSADALAVTASEELQSAIAQKTAVEELATTTEQLFATATQNSEVARTAMGAVKQTETYLNESQLALLQLMRAVEQVSVSSEEIQTINNMINDISRQTNMLSLNAMIEAARSGENGGFKVVALEVKKLAERSAEAADKINQLLLQNMAAVEQGVDLSQTMAQRFQEITEKMQPLTQTIQHVADASFEQKEAVRQINAGLGDIDRAIEKNRARAEESSALANALRQNAAALMGVVNALDIDIKTGQHHG